MAQHKLDQLSSKYKLTIISGSKRVSAPLPDDFGFTVGSEYTTPFDMGSMSSLLQKAYAVGGISNPVGIRMRKMYANPEPVEISFDMDFAAFYSAKEEVVVPIVTLMVMGLGHITTNEDIERGLRKMGALAVKASSLTGILTSEARQVNDATNGAAEEFSTSEESKYTAKLLSLINVISSPETVTIKFGDFLTLTNAFITSTAVQFSNLLDKDGYPMTGKVSVTCTLQVAPVAEDILGMFGGPNVIGVGVQ